jgi:hypothetical protein
VKLPRFDVRKKHAVSLTFLLDEEVTPALFAQKIARACKEGALRPGEGIRVPGTDGVLVVTDETLSLPAFGCEPYRAVEARPRAHRRRRGRLVSR